MFARLLFTAFVLIVFFTFYCFCVNSSALYTLDMTSTATLDTCMPAEDVASMKDVDMVFIENFPTERLSLYISGDVTLANQRINSRMATATLTSCCIVSSPSYIFVRDDCKAEIASCLIRLTSHKFLPTSQTVGRFLSTSRGRRVSASSLLQALLAANIAFVSVETYGQKSPVADYANLLSSLHPTSTFTIDLGLTFILSSPSTIPVIYKSNPLDMGTTTIYRMFSDYIASSPFAHFKVGTVEWSAAGEPVQLQSLQVRRVKMYPEYVHWLKTFPASIFTLPSNYARLKERLAVMDDVATALPNISADDKEKMREVRLEATVSGVGPLDVNVASLQVIPFLRHLASHFTAVEVDLTLLSRHIRAWLDRANLAALSRGPNANPVRGLKRHYARQLLNEVGVAIDSQQLWPRRRDGTYRWETTRQPPYRLVTEDVQTATDQLAQRLLTAMLSQQDITQVIIFCIIPQNYTST